MNLSQGTNQKYQLNPSNHRILTPKTPKTLNNLINPNPNQVRLSSPVNPVLIKTKSKKLITTN